MSAPELPTPLKPLRTDLITTALNFLNDPHVKSAPLSKRLAFLEGKGLTQEEIDLAIIKSNIGGISNNQSTTIPITHQEQQSQAKSSGYKRLILTTAVLLGASSLLISNYQTIKEFAQKFFKSPENPDSSGDEIKKLEREFKQSIQELKDLMEEKEKKLQATLEDLVNK